jgi:hypothetical protein
MHSKVAGGCDPGSTKAWQGAVAHATCLEDTLLVFRAGANGTTHICYDQPITQEVLDLYKQNDAWCNPTLAAIRSFTGEGRECIGSTRKAGSGTPTGGEEKAKDHERATKGTDADQK